MSGRLEGKVAVITGGGSGIGRGVCRALHAEGARVVAADVSGTERDLAASLGKGAIGIKADVTSNADLVSLIGAACDRFGQVDIMVNVAGVSGLRALTVDTSEEEFDRVIAVNLKGVFLGMRAVLPALVAQNSGSIINMASIASLVGAPKSSAYSASKGGVLALTRSTALEYASAGVRVNAICPGPIDTPMFRGDADGRASELLARGASRIPVGRMGTVADIAAMTVFLASDESAFVTGAAFAVDGGVTAA